MPKRTGPNAPIARREFVSALALGTVLGSTTTGAQSPAVHREANQRWTTAIPVADFVAPNTGHPAGEALQAAIDTAFEVGFPLIMPRGEWNVDRTLTIENPDRKRRGFPSIIGSGDTRLMAGAFDGPLMSIRGAPKVPPAGACFLTGGLLERLEFHGNKARKQNGLDILGWSLGIIRSCSFENFSGHGVRVYGDKTLDPNPDWTSSIVRMDGVRSVRNGGWGFFDDNPIGAPTWVFDRCVFDFNGAGGAFVQSSGNLLLGCSFVSNGYLDETTPAPGFGVGLRIGDADGSAVNRLRLEIAEFGENKDAHILIDRATSFLIEDARFIQGNWITKKHLVPPVCVQIGSGPKSLAYNGKISRSVFRNDSAGTVTAFSLRTPAALDFTIERGYSSDETNGKVQFTHYDGFGTPEERFKKRIVIDERS